MNDGFRLRASVVATIACVSAVAAVAHAGERNAMPADVPVAYTQECASCHTAYPPGMLPAASWHRVMNTLDRHYGTDASLDEDTTARIAAWLRRRAGTWKRRPRIASRARPGSSASTTTSTRPSGGTQA